MKYFPQLSLECIKLRIVFQIRAKNVEQNTENSIQACGKKYMSSSVKT